MSRQVPDPAQPYRSTPPVRRDRRRSGLVALAVTALCVLLAGLAAATATLSRSAAGAKASSALRPVGAGGTGRSSQAPAPVAAQHANPFSAAMTAYLAGRAGTVTAALDDLSTGQTWTLGRGQPQPTASLVKVDILETLLAARPDGLSATDRSLAQSMIENSDNDAATALWHAAGGPDGLRSYNLLVGLRQTRPSACLVCAGFPWPGWGLTTTTPADQVLLLRQLFAGPLLSSADRDFATSLLENVRPGQRWGVSAGVPAGVRVALKNGWVPLTAPDANWQVNSEGRISGDGRNYLVAILVTGNPSERYGIDTINALSAQLWSAMR